MTVIIKRPAQSRERNKDFFKRKDQELTNLDWAKWGGWKDTDGFFFSRKGVKREGKAVGLKLKDRQPAELFSETFETSLLYQEHPTIAPNGKKYIAKEYVAILCGPKAVWFTKNVYPYLIKEKKKDYAANLLGYRPESKDLTTWTTDEVLHYLGTAIAGDGSFQNIYSDKAIKLNIYSSDIQYLADLQSIAEDKFKITSGLGELSIYKTQKGMKTKYVLYIYGSINCNTGFFKSLTENNIMTLDRKKHKIEKFVSRL